MAYFLEGFANSCSRKQLFIFFSSVFGCLGWVSLGFFFLPSTPHPDEASMEFDSRSMKFQLPLSVLNLQLSVWLHSFWSLLPNLSGSHLIYLIYILLESGISTHKDFLLLLSPCYIKLLAHYYSLICRSYSVVPVNLVTW